MPRFFVHVRSNGHCWSYDEFGLDFPDVETACSQTLCVAQDLISVFATRDQDPRDHAIEIENEAGEVVLYMPFSEIFVRDFDASAGAAVAFRNKGVGTA
jgi:Tfp pilus assembly ATPase PilU